MVKDRDGLIAHLMPHHLGILLNHRGIFAVGSYQHGGRSEDANQAGVL